MSSIFSYISILIIGIMATLGIDIYSALLKRYFNIPSLDYKFVGRWLLYIPKGKLIHHNIIQTPALKAEKRVGWLSHYSIGIIFAAVLICSVGPTWFSHPDLTLAIIFGLSTVSFPFFIMQPCFGFGIAASKLNKPYFARLKSLMTHALFGLGLYLATRFLSILQ